MLSCVVQMQTDERVQGGRGGGQGKLRIGLAEQTVLQALGFAVVLQRDGAKNHDGGLAGRTETGAQKVKQAYSECPSYDKLIPALLEHPLAVRPCLHPVMGSVQANIPSYVWICRR